MLHLLHNLGVIPSQNVCKYFIFNILVEGSNILLILQVQSNITVFNFLSYLLKTDIDDCTSHPCKNNGNCTDRVNGFNCSCAPGFSGTQCETSN